MKLYAVLIGNFCGVLLGFARADAARADTPQLAVGRMSASYNHLDLTNYMAVYARGYTRINVSGKRQAYLPLQASIAGQFTSQNHAVLQCKLSRVTMHGNTAQGTLAEHYVLHQTHYAPRYVGVRDITSNVFWAKGPLGWQMTSAQMSRDVNTYQRL